MRLTITAVLFAVLFAFIGCGKGEEDSADQRQAKETGRLTAEAQRQVGMPNIINFQERKLMKMILELRDKEDLICYAYLYNRDKGSIGQCIGQCIGFGLPYSVQFTNPERIAKARLNYGYIKLPQPDPNGLFMPEGLSATWSSTGRMSMDDARLNEIHKVCVPLSKRIAALERALAGWRPKGEIQDELAKANAERSVFIREIAGIMDAPTEDESEGADAE
jgi:hypothetical protein